VTGGTVTHRGVSEEVPYVSYDEITMRLMGRVISPLPQGGTPW